MGASQRDSHDLSLPSRHVRDSLVSNMLLSLDQFSMGTMTNSMGPLGHMGPLDGSPGASAGQGLGFGLPPSRTAHSFDDHRLFSISTTTTTTTVADDMSVARGFPSNAPPPISRGPARHGYSYSSDYEGADDASRISGSIHSRGHRSNSSSGFQSSLGRINSMRESLRRPSQPGTPRLMHARGGGKASKSSSTNSFDNTLAYASPRHTVNRRSNSFDLGQQSARPLHTALHTAPSTSGQQASPWHLDFSTSFFNKSYDDAAPTPHIPGGPRKLTSVPSMPIMPRPSYDMSAADAVPVPSIPDRAPERRRSVRSARSAIVGRQPPQKFNTPAPPLPVFDLDSAPAPHVGYEKSKDILPAPTPAQQQLQQQQSSSMPPPQKERPGFFKRVFGTLRDSVVNSDSNPSNTNNANNAASAAPAANDAAAARSHTGKSQSTPPSRDSHQPAHPTVQKKPSGFFRRRKKSFSEPVPAPPPLPTAQVQTLIQEFPPPPPSKSPPATAMLAPSPAMPSARDERLLGMKSPSPVTSLRRAMSPYLKGNVPYPDGVEATAAVDDEEFYDAETELAPTKPADPDDLSRRAVRGFSPDYEPSPKATIRSVGPDQEPRADGRPDTPTREPPFRAPAHPARTGSFLSDNSDNEDSPEPVKPSLSAKPSQQLQPDRHVKPHASHSSLVAALASPATTITSPMSGGDSALLSPTSAAAASAHGPRSGGSGKRGESDAHAHGSKPGSPNVQEQQQQPLDEPEFVIGDPTEDDRNKALNIFEGNEDFIQREKAASWMGEEGPVRQRTLRAYMELYDFHCQSIVSALREVCSRLILRAETQQVDRILVTFSKRWCTCNPNHGFKSLDIVHTICYSIMLLNTDLHVADIESKMTRNQFIKNTMTSIRQTVAECEPEPPKRSGKNSTMAPPTDTSSRRQSVAPHQEHSHSLLPSRSGLLPPRSGSSLGHSHNDEGGGPLVSAPFDGPMPAWEAQMEAVLKDIYASIRDERLPLFGAEANPATGPNNAGGLTVMGMLKRSPSVLSKTPSEGQVSTRGRNADQGARTGSSRWASKSRSRARVSTAGGPGSSGGLGSGNGFSSSRTSLEDANSMWSPTVSSATWSRQSLGRTQASMSMESFGSSWGRGEYHQSIGFANALSQAIIREDGMSMGGHDDQSVHNGASGGAASTVGGDNALLDDESLELAGPPWVKEGIVTHKHHVGSSDKKAKDRNWTEVFAVVQKGQISLFSFTPNKSVRSKNRTRGFGQGASLGAGLAGGGGGGGGGGAVVVGGGNWQDNATNLGTFGLKQALASALPPPGYSRQRPHVWALSLPTGAVHLFQVGTPEICREFVTTANYWSARLSTHPLVGGISNMEFGWSDSIVHNPLVTAIHSETGATDKSHPPVTARPGSAAAVGARASMQSRASFRSSSFEFGHGRSGSSSSGLNLGLVNSSTAGGLHPPGSSGGGLSSLGSTLGVGGAGKLPGDRIHIADWQPPTQSMRASRADEPAQLAVLSTYVQSIEEDLQLHNQLRSPMLLAFTPRSHNAQKAMTNWERKSAYLLREIVKYRTYVDCLTEAERRRAEIYHERDIARRAALGEESEPSEAGDSDGEEREDDGSDHSEVEGDEEVDDPNATLRP